MNDSQLGQAGGQDQREDTALGCPLVGTFSSLARWTCDVPTRRIRDWLDSPCRAQTSIGTPLHGTPFPSLPHLRRPCLSQALLDKKWPWQSIRQDECP